MIDKILNIVRKLVPKRIFRFFQPAYHFILALTGNVVYRFPGRKMICIGVTGTNGKSTTAELINSILKEAGYKTGMLSTVAFEIGGTRSDNKTSRTTLGRWQTPKMLRRMVKAGCDYAIIEVASEGIVQFRTWGIPFDVAVFTNLSPEHLNTHKTMANYRNAKGKLFANLSLSKKKKFNKKKVPKVNIFNAEDKESGYFGSFPADVRLGYGLKKGDICAKNIKEKSGLEFVVSHKGKHYLVKSNLVATFNVYNILAAWAVGISQNIEPNVIAVGIANLKSVKGRMEKVAEKNGVQYFIDYAMTADSYEMLFSEMRKLAKGKLIAVFGAAGDRDRSKRPVIGEVAAKMTDYIILTDDEPYSEDPKAIISEIEAGIKKTKFSHYEIIHDRKKAFEKATKIAKSGDVVIVPGMGHESFRNVGGNKRIPWNEAELIKQIVNKSK
jgi:UDP-N-acetylmuramoyl-L-alanyl-D-glutamate--2,6-diaminopimelate ligase